MLDDIDTPATGSVDDVRITPAQHCCAGS